MEERLVSIIVPVYNVEKQLVHCVDSILKQTYKNIEILLIDDGSPDNCSAICDSYTKEDTRIKTFHKKNGGLSSARNYGLDRAKGDYISFIDSDDWVDQDFIEIMVNNLEKEKSDISIIGYKLVWDSGKIINSSNKNDYEIYDQSTAIHELLVQKKFQCMACTKLYKKELFNHIRFPEGKLFEDIAISLPLFKKCSRVVLSGQQKYYYYQRDGSIVNSAFDYRKMVILEYCRDIINFSKECGGTYDKEANAFYLKAMLMLILNIYDTTNNSYIEERKILSKEIKKCRKYILFNPYLEARRQAVLWAILMKVSPKLLNKLWRIRTRQKLN